MQMLKQGDVKSSVEGEYKEKTAKIEEKTRKTGIDAVGDAPLGTHFCLFYETKEDLTDILVPYFKAGLEGNEFCMWVTSEPLREEEAKEAMRKAVPNFDGYVERGQIEIVPHTEWYLKDGVFNLQRVLNDWVEKLDQALLKGYDGMRVTGNTAWLEKRDWKDFVDYEQEVANVISEYRMIAICTYSLDKCGASEVVEVVRNHQFAVIKREGKWEFIESSELKRSNETLRENEEKMRTVLNSMHDLVFGIDMNGNFQSYHQPSHRPDLYRSPEGFVGKHFREVLPPDVADLLQTAMERIEASDKPQQFDYSLKIKDQERWFDASLSPVKDQSGSLTGITVVVRDITERKATEDALRKSESESRALLENLPQKIFFKDKNSVYISCNENYARDLKIKADEIAGWTDYDFYPKILAEKYRADDKRIMESGKTEEIEEEYIQDGQKVYVHTVKTPAKDENDNVIGVLGIFWDVTDRKRMENELKRYAEHLATLVEERTRKLKETQKQLLKAERLAAIGEVAAMVGHDLRNPLQVITNMVYISGEKFKSFSITEKETLEKCGFLELRNGLKEQVEYMDKIVSDLQDYARPVKTKPVEIGLRQFINKTLASLFVPENVRVSIMIEEDCPKLMLDPVFMQRVFSNLITNAVQAMPNGGQLTIRASKREEHAALISIEDTGEGIPDEDLSKLFTPLFTTKAKGQGFGLPVCKRLVEAHDGNITVKSEVGKGSTFTVEIPLRKEVSKK
jgi:PAS domain S-box-containing protein